MSVNDAVSSTTIDGGIIQPYISGVVSVTLSGNMPSVTFFGYNPNSILVGIQPTMTSAGNQ